MRRANVPDASFPKLLTPIGGMIASIVVGGALWSGLLVGMHVAGMF